MHIKTTVIVIIGLVGVFSLLSSFLTPVFAQQINDTDFTTFFKDNKDFQFYAYATYPPTGCHDAIDMLYQDNSTIALKSQNMDMIWKAVLIVKKDGYKIDGISTYVTPEAVGTDIFNTVNILVAMSK